MRVSVYWNESSVNSEARPTTRSRGRASHSTSPDRVLTTQSCGSRTGSRYSILKYPVLAVAVLLSPQLRFPRILTELIEPRRREGADGAELIGDRRACRGLARVVVQDRVVREADPRVERRDVVVGQPDPALAGAPGALLELRQERGGALHARIGDELPVVAGEALAQCSDRLAESRGGVG